MNAAGELVVRVHWDGRRVTGVDVDLGRPQAAALLIGKPTDDVLGWVPRLFSVCGRAQAAAARAALGAAGRQRPAADEAEGILAEAAQEHLWRLLRDWPRALGLAPRDDEFAAWYRRLSARPLAAGTGGELQAYVEQLLGRDFARLRTFDEIEAFARAGGGHAAALLAALPLEEAGAAPTPRFLAGDLPLAGLPCPLDPTGDADRRFIERPTVDGAPAETGALARQRHRPLVADGLARLGASLRVRLVARLHDALAVGRALAGEADAAWDPTLLVAAAPLASSLGAARAETARGVLLHFVRLEGDRVADYAIVAPTAWNFHPQGALAAALTGAAAVNEPALEALVTRHVVAVDPCVGWRMEVRRA